MAYMSDGAIINGDVFDILPLLEDESVQMCVTSPPYWGLRDYGVDGQLGLEKTPEEYVQKLVAVFREVRRILKGDGTLWLNLGDSYAANCSYQVPSTKGGAKHSPAQGFDGSAMRVPAGLKPKDLVGIPWMVAFALRADGWYLRQDLIWSKPNTMPESVKDRCTRSHEYIFMLSKSQKYYYDHEAIKEPCVCTNPFQFVDGGEDKQRGHTRRHAGFNRRYKDKILQDGAPTTRNKRSVWEISTKPYKGAHFATFPPDLIEPCILAGSRIGDIVLDPFGGSGTVGMVAKKHNRDYLLIELNDDYCKLAEERIQGKTPSPPKWVKPTIKYLTPEQLEQLSA